MWMKEKFRLKTEMGQVDVNLNQICTLEVLNMK